MQEVPFGSLQSREYDERVPFEAALLQDDCYTDRDGVQGRNGYRAATAAAIGSGTVQAVARFRPTAVAARTIVARGGHLWAVTDPSSETASDGVATEIVCSPNPPFSDASLIRLVQFGKYMYASSSVASENWQRIKPDFTAEAFASLAKPGAPSVVTSSLAFILLTTGTATPGGGATIAASAIGSWLQVTSPIGGTITFDLGSDVDASGIKWLFIACSPSTQGGGGGTFRIEVASAAGAFESITDMFDTPGNDAPYAVYASLVGLTTLTRGHIRRLRFTQVTNANAFFLSGYMFAPSAPGPGEVDYYVTYRNSTTGQESDLSAVIPVVYSSDGIAFPTFGAARSSGNSFVGAGSQSTNPDTLDQSALFNKGAGKASPLAAEFSSVRTFSNAAVMPAGSYDKARLYRVTATGTRLVKEAPATPLAAIGAGYSITDDTGDATLSHQSYVAGGSPSAATALAAVGGRLISGGDPANPPRLNISSYLPFGQVVDPFPQYPAVPLQTSDGNAFDIASTSAEQILWLGEGDLSLFIGTNEAMYLLADLSPNLTPPYSVPTKIWVRGVSGRQAAIWAERQVYWAATDACYYARNRVAPEEMTGAIRFLYRNWFLPDPSVVLGYQDRRLYLVRGVRMLRYDFVTERWSRHNLSHAMGMCAFWRDPYGTIQQLWFLSTNGNLYRWQPGTGAGDPNRATSDAGAAIPNWTYRTGYVVGESKARIKGVLLDRTGDVTVTAFKDASTSASLSFVGAGESQAQFTPMITAYKFSLQFSGSNLTALRRAMWQRLPTAGEGV
jgi:hypothetical protein